jgi:hypothetical protein
MLLEEAIHVRRASDKGRMGRGQLKECCKKVREFRVGGPKAFYRREELPEIRTRTPKKSID